MARRRALWIIVGVLAAMPEANAADGERFSGYRVDVWRDDQGLPQNSITSIAQDDRGFLWVSTFGGIARFDGSTFDPLNLTNGLRSPRALVVRVGANQEIWVGFQDRGLQRLRDRRPRPLAAAMDVTRGDVYEIDWSGESQWIVNGGRASVWEDGAWKVIAENVAALVPDGRGGVWLSRGRSAWLATATSSTSAVTVNDRILSTSLGPDGALWFVTNAGLHRIHEGRAQHVLAAVGVSEQAAGPVFGPDGDIFFAQGPTVHRHPSIETLEEVMDAGGAAIPPDESSTWSTTIRTMMTDRERNVWIGTVGDGLWRLSPEPFEVISAPASSYLAATAVVGVDDGVVFGNQCGSVTHLANDGTQKQIEVPGCIQALWYDPPDRALWVCGEDLERHDDHGRKRFELPRTAGQCTALHRSRDGRLWVGSHHGLQTFDGHAFRRVDHVEGPVSTIAESEDGALWVGEHNRVTVLDGDTHRVLGQADGIPKGEVRAIAFYRQETFVGTYGGGVARISPAGAVHYDRTTGLLDDFISFIVADNKGRVWLSGNRALVRVPIEDFDAVANGERRLLRARPIRLGEPEGGPNPAGFFDGRKLWIPTLFGLGRVDVDRVVTNPVPPVAVIDGGTLDGHPLVPNITTTVPPGRGELRVRFRAPLMRAPRLRAFEYRLVGLENDWVRTEDRDSAVYEHLAPGTYRFEVRAINEDRVAGPTTTMPFIHEPKITDTDVFRGSVALFVLLVAWGSHRAQTKRIQRRNEVLSKEIDSRRIAESTLRDSKAHYLSVFTSSVNGFFVVLEDRKILETNPAVSTMFGYSAEELVGRNVDEIIGAEAPKVDAPGVLLYRRKDGSTFEARVRETTYPIGKSMRTLITIVDLSPLVEAQLRAGRLREQLLHSQRVEAMGRLAGGIAHDVNNMLTAVKCYADLAMKNLHDTRSVRADLMEITAGVERTTKLTKQLLAFGQRETAKPRAVDLADSVKAVMPMLSRLSRDDIDIKLDIQSSVGPVHADPTHLEQIVLNLVINATHALPTGGHILVQVDEIDASLAAEEYPDLVLDGWHVRLRVEDDGIGMSDDVRRRVFEPFFSTKESQESSGLGLSVVHGIVTQSGGQVVLTSAPGEGARFDVLLPRSSAIIDDLPARPGQEPLRANGERLLYCDDDGPARRATARALRGAGYDVVVADGPLEAIALARKTHNFSLLVTDFLMPEMNGRALFHALRNDDPALTVLYVSGYAMDDLETLDSSERFLPKPYSPDELVGQIRKLIDANQGQGSPPPTSPS